jgi:hypothetical protein
MQIQAIEKNENCFQPLNNLGLKYKNRSLEKKGL